MRYLIYFLFRADGRVDGYVPHFLNHVRDYFDVIHVVTNGKLIEEGKAMLTMADRIQERANEEFDVGAYKDALFSNPDSFYDSVDELTLANFTFFAPIGSFEPVFDWAKAQDVDFWGLSAHKSMDPNPFTGEGVLPYHIQSHWITVRKPILQRPEFLAYWRDLPPITSYMDSVLFHESQFTRHFAELGHSYSLYFDDAPYDSAYPAFNCIDEALENGLPILKRRLLYHTPSFYFDNHDVNLRRALDRIEAQDLFPMEMIWESAAGIDPGALYQSSDLLRVVPTARDLGTAPAEAFEAVVLLSGRIDASTWTALERSFALPCRLTLLLPAGADPAAIPANLGAAAGPVTVETYDDAEAAFDRLAALAAGHADDRPLLFVSLDAGRLKNFRYGMAHLAADPVVAERARAEVERSRFFGLGLPVIRTFGAPAETDMLTEARRSELHEDLAGAAFKTNTGTYFLFSQAGVFWIRPSLLQAAAADIRANMVERRPVFSDLMPDAAITAPALDPGRVDSYLSVGLPLLAAKRGLITLTLSNTAEMPRAFVKAEARLRTFSERIGADTPFVLDNRAEFLSRFLDDEGRATFLGEAHRVAYEAGREAGIGALRKEHENSLRLASEVAWKQGHAAARRELGAPEDGDAMKWAEEQEEAQADFNVLPASLMREGGAALAEVRAYAEARVRQNWKKGYETAMTEMRGHIREVAESNWKRGFELALEQAQEHIQKVARENWQNGFNASQQANSGGHRGAYDQGWRDAEARAAKEREAQFKDAYNLGWTEALERLKTDKTLLAKVTGQKPE